MADRWFGKRGGKPLNYNSVEVFPILQFLEIVLCDWQLLIRKN